MIDYENTFHVIDDMFTAEEIAHVQSQMTSPGFDWYFGATRDKTVSNDAYRQLGDDNTFEQFQLVHWFVVNGQQVPTDYAEVGRFLSTRIAARAGLGALKIDRIKANLQTRTLSTRKYNTPHVDSRMHRHIVAIYYVNDSDGRTWIFRNDEAPLKVAREVRSKAGRVVIFDGRLFHSGSHPRRSDYRMVVNFNFLL